MERSMYMRKTYGYVRVSSQDQNEARQYLELLDMGIDKSIFTWIN